MARRTREGAARMARLVNGPTVQCGTCGVRFWTEAERNAHYGKTPSGITYCQR
jgi:hypothetical protein